MTGKGGLTGYWDRHPCETSRGTGGSKRNLKKKKATTKLNGTESLLEFKPTRPANKIVQGHMPKIKGEEQNDPARDGGNIGKCGDTGDGWKLPHELLDNGQRKSTSSDMESSNSSDEDAPPSSTTNTTTPTCSAINKPINLLSPPIIMATGNIATLATTDTLCKQNRCHRDEALARQPIVSQ